MDLLLSEGRDGQNAKSQLQKAGTGKGSLGGGHFSIGVGRRRKQTFLKTNPREGKEEEEGDLVGENDGHGQTEWDVSRLKGNKGG